MPVYTDKVKGPEFAKRLVNFAKESGYTDQEISMMVDHRSLLLLADAYRYNQIKKAKLANKKVSKNSKTVSSNAANVRENAEINERVDNRMKRLKKSGTLRDAQSVLKEMFQN